MGKLEPEWDLFMIYTLYHPFLVWCLGVSLGKQWKSWDRRVDGNLGGALDGTGWWLTYPSEKWWSESQLGWWHSQLNGKIIQMFRTTNQSWEDGKKPPNMRQSDLVCDAIPASVLAWSQQKTLGSGCSGNQTFSTDDFLVKTWDCPLTCLITARILIIWG